MRLDDAPSVFEWIELVLASYRNTQRLERVKDSHRRGVLGQDFRQSLVSVRRLVNSTSTQFNPGFIHPGVHHLLGNLRLALPLTGCLVSLALGLHPAHDATGTVDG